MHQYKISRLPKKSLEIILTIPKTDIDIEYTKAFERLQKELTVEGFRKGKVPYAIAEKHLRKEAVFQELIKEILPKIYEEIVQKEGLKPVINPKIELVKAKEGEDWEIKITLCEKPTVEINNYKEIIKNIKADSKKSDIWVPGKATDKQPKPEDQEKKKQELLNQILGALLKEAKIEMSDLIIEEDLSRRLTQLLDDIQKIGLTVEAYLKSKNLTMDQLKEKYRLEIIDTYKLEFLLNEIADKEGIKVEKEDIDKLFTNIKDEKERKMAEANSYFYASIMRKQKTLDYLLVL